MLPDEVDGILDKLDGVRHRTELVIVWASNFESVRNLERRSSETGLTGLIWIAMTDMWINVEKYRPWLGQNVIMLSIDDIDVTNFITHKNGIIYESPIGNVWFKKYWVSQNICPPITATLTSTILHYNRNCQHIPTSGEFFGQKFSENVIASVYTFAHALHHLLNCTEASCNGQSSNFTEDSGNREYHRRQNIDYKKLKKLILRPDNEVVIPSSNFTVKFLPNGDIRANIYHFYLYTNRSKEMGRVNFGNWNRDRNLIQINKTLFWDTYNNATVYSGGRSENSNARSERLKSNITTRTNVRSSEFKATCSTQCMPGFYRVNESSSCCWVCIECPYNKVSLRVDSRGCQKCGQLEVPNKDRTGCVRLANAKFTFNSLTGMCVGFFSVIGMMFLLFVMLAYGVFWETPGVKSTNREMSLMQALCLFLLLFLPVLYLFEVEEICAARMVMFGSLHSSVLIFVLLKTYRLWRLFQPHFFKKNVRLFLSLPTQVSISFAIFLLQLVFFSIWYVFINRPSLTVYTNSAEKGFAYHCGHHENYLLYAIVVYISLLALASGFIAFRARKLPENFNEAQFIWLAMFTYWVVWLVFFPLYLSSNKLHQPTVLLSLNLASTVVLSVVLYGNKMRMLICFPHLNTKLHFTGLAKNATVRTYSLQQRLSRKGKNDKKTDKSGKKSSQQAKNRVISFSFEKTNE